ncbi:unnamed protein product [Amoebophrya sp. A25]|nr:unnamed protein product [Amoebophrya sp. A25]|eukprot:GSA25T00002911001.1
MGLLAALELLEDHSSHVEPDHFHEPEHLHEPEHFHHEHHHGSSPSSASSGSSHTHAFISVSHPRSPSTSFFVVGRGPASSSTASWWIRLTHPHPTTASQEQELSKQDVNDSPLSSSTITAFVTQEQKGGTMIVPTTEPTRDVPAAEATMTDIIRSPSASQLLDELLPFPLYRQPSVGGSIGLQLENMFPSARRLLASGHDGKNLLSNILHQLFGDPGPGGTEDLHAQPVLASAATTRRSDYSVSSHGRGQENSLALVVPRSSNEEEVLTTSQEQHQGELFFAGALSESELAAHAMQLRVARSIAGTTLAGAAALFTSLCYKLSNRSNGGSSKRRKGGTIQTTDSEDGGPLNEEVLEDAEILF